MTQITATNHRLPSNIDITPQPKPKKVAIIGAGAAGLMAADVLSMYDIHIDVFE